MLLKIVVLTREEPFYVPIYLNGLSGHSIQKIFIDSEPSPFLTKHQVFQMCSLKSFLILGFKTIILRMLGHFSFRRKGKYFCSVRSFAKHHGIPYTFGFSPKEQGFLDEMNVLSPDIILSIANKHIISKEIVAVPKYGCMNSHSSILPGYKGVLTGFWHLLNQEQIAGVSFHMMTEKVDDGRVIGQRCFHIESGETIFSFYEKAAFLAETLLPTCLDRIENSSPIKIGTKTDVYQCKSFFCRKPKQTDVNSFINAGLRFC